MFDLPTLTAKQRRDYRQFVKLIKKIGFIMFQESIYVKLSVNEANVKSSLDMIKNTGLHMVARLIDELSFFAHH